MSKLVCDPYYASSGDVLPTAFSVYCPSLPAFPDSPAEVVEPGVVRLGWEIPPLQDLLTFEVRAKTAFSISDPETITIDFRPVRKPTGLKVE